MSAADTAAIIAGAGLVLTLLVNGVIVGMLYGSLKARVALLESQREQLATKEQIQGLSIQVAEIRGMFILTPKIQGNTPPIV